MLKKAACGIQTNLVSVVLGTCPTHMEYSIDLLDDQQKNIADRANPSFTSKLGLQDTPYLRHGLDHLQSGVRCCSSSSSSSTRPCSGRKRYRPGEVKQLLRSLTSTAESALLEVHAKCQLEVQDPKHRYGKFLRAYHKEWNRIGQPEQDFFIWLDGASVDLQHIPFSALNAEVVRYIEDEDAQQKYLVEFKNGRLHRHGTDEFVTTGESGWIFVLKNNQLYASKKVTNSSPRFHHTSFLGGGRVQMAGIFMAVDGKITAIYPHSGHYRPRETNLLLLLLCLIDNGCDLHKAEVDMQRTMRVARDIRFCEGVQPEKGIAVKQPKMNSTYMWKWNEALDFLLSLRAWSESGACTEIRSRIMEKGH